MVSGKFYVGLEELLDQKNITIEEKRKITATGLAVELIAAAITREGSEHKLSEEMNNLPAYVKTLCESLSL